MSPEPSDVLARFCPQRLCHSSKARTMDESEVKKTCCSCGADLTHRKRHKNHLGEYYCPGCVGRQEGIIATRVARSLEQETASARHLRGYRCGFVLAVLDVSGCLESAARFVTLCPRAIGERRRLCFSITKSVMAQSVMLKHNLRILECLESAARFVTLCPRAIGERPWLAPTMRGRSDRVRENPNPV